MKLIDSTSIAINLTEMAAIHAIREEAPVPNSFSCLYMDATTQILTGSRYDIAIVWSYLTLHRDRIQWIQDFTNGLPGDVEFKQMVNRH